MCKGGRNEHLNEKSLQLFFHLKKNKSKTFFQSCPGILPRTGGPPANKTHAPLSPRNFILLELQGHPHGGRQCRLQQGLTWSLASGQTCPVSGPARLPEPGLQQKSRHGPPTTSRASSLMSTPPDPLLQLNLPPSCPFVVSGMSE